MECINPETFVKLSPAFKDYLWGGTKLREIYGKDCDYDIVAESWELSAHEAGQSVIASGRYKGMAFSQYLQTIGKDYWGWKCQSLSTFPILIKFIDAKSNLSIQVHPDDDYALVHEQEYGKNEMWYILDCEEGAGVYCGFNREVNREEVKRKVKDNTIIEILNWIPVKKGDVIFIKPGTVHAIAKGILICEIQQSSNSTYRLYDYDRRDKFGNPRELHLKKSLDVLDYNKYQTETYQSSLAKYKGYTRQLLGRCKYFECVSYIISEHAEIEIDKDSFYSLICVVGNAQIIHQEEVMDIKAGESVFIPMNQTKILVIGHCEIILTHI